jgi:hypothetical protein
MCKSETMTTDTGTAGEPDVLTDKDLDAVTGGVGGWNTIFSIVNTGATAIEVYSISFGVCTGWENHSARRPSG